MCHCSLKGSRSTSHACQPASRVGGVCGQTYGAGWEPPSGSSRGSKKSHDGHSLGNLHDGGEGLIGLGEVVMVAWKLGSFG